MQLFINNWSTSLSEGIDSNSEQLQIEPALASQLLPLDAADHYLLTLVEVDDTGREVAWEILRLAAVNGDTGLLTLAEAGRGQEGTSARPWPSGSLLAARATAGTLAELQALAAAALASCEPLVQILLIDSPSLELSAAHLNKLLEFNQACTLTIPPGTWPSSAKLWLCRGSAGEVHVVEGEAVTVLKPASRQAALAEPGAVATLIKRPQANSWRLFGDLLPTDPLPNATLLTEAGNPLTTEADAALLLE